MPIKMIQPVGVLANNNMPGSSAYARYASTTSAVTTSFTPVTFLSQTFDPTPALMYASSGPSSGAFVIPAAGRYTAVASVLVSGTVAAANTVDLLLQQKNSSGTIIQNSEAKVFAGGVEGSVLNMVHDIFNCTAGDTVRLYVASSITGPSMASGTSASFFSISKIN